MKKLTYEYVKEYIEGFGYKLHTTKDNYIDTKHHIMVQCNCGHDYYPVVFSSFKLGSRCKKCHIDSQKLKYNDVKTYIEDFEGYKLISKEYIGSRIN